MKLRYVMALSALAAAAISFGQGTLAIGDTAPKLAVSKWVKGTPVKEFEKGKLYVVEFWATWCGPCKTSIPHLTDLAKKYKDKVSFIGVSVWESDQKEVAPFVKQMGDKMAYNVAMDKLPDAATDPSTGAMAKSWMTAAGQNGIPAAFIIDREGKVAWIGHPMEMEATLAKVVGGSYGASDYQKAKDGQEMTLRIADFNQKIRAAKTANDESQLLTILDQMMADTNPGIRAAGGTSKFKYFLSKKRFDEAYPVAKSLVEGVLKDEGMALNDLAWTIVDPARNLEKKDLDVAMSAAKRSVDLDKNYANLDTLARVFFLKGDKAKAIELQKEAMAMAPDSEKKAMADTIKEYGG
jgi:thiol-disulfide isomerase/thioredoxin